MARERYLVDAEEDSIHSNQIVLTDKKAIRANWWYYHKRIVLWVVLAAAMVGSFIYSIVSKVEPDYEIGMLTSFQLPEELVTEFEEYLALYADDRNDDGKVVVTLNSYVIGDPVNDTSTDPSMFQAALARFTADASSGQSMIYLHDDKTFSYLSGTGFEGFLRYNDGTDMPDDRTDYENAMLAWNDVAAFADFRPTSLNASEVSTEDTLTLFERYRLSIRSSGQQMNRKPEAVEYYEKSDEFYHRLLNNVKVERENPPTE